MAGYEHFFKIQSDNEFSRPLPILAQYWRWLAYGKDSDNRYMPDIDAPGSYLEMYWWDVINSMKSEWEAAKHEDAKGDQSTTGSKGPRKRRKNAPRKKPQLRRSQNKG